MAAKDLELILMRQLAGYLAMPMFIVDASGDLVFYNEAAESIVGRRFDEMGPMPATQLLSSFQQTDDDGNPIPREQLPLVISLTERRPAYKRFWIKGLDGRRRNIEVSAIPLIGPLDRYAGAVAIFWEVTGGGRAKSAIVGGKNVVELILLKQLAGYLAMPMFIVDPGGDLIFYNEAAEPILGRRFDETGPMPESEWGTLFEQADNDGNPIPTEELPLVIALDKWRPAYNRYWIKGLDGKRRNIEVSAIPLIGPLERYVGAVAIFWEDEDGN